VIQLYTWAYALARTDDDKFLDSLTERLLKSIDFLCQHQDEATGGLPNYGANDGSLFFPLSSCGYNDFRPQLNALNCVLKGTDLYTKGKWQEEARWFGASVTENPPTGIIQRTASFKTGGYYVLRGRDRFAFIRCCRFMHRPSQADNLHLDIWFKGENILRDSGSYLYNSDAETVGFFGGTRSHNTVMLDKHDQMEKGPRFIWYKWSQAIGAEITEHDEYVEFHGKIRAFCQVAEPIVHTRIVRQYRTPARWEIIDNVDGWEGECRQIWNLSPAFKENGFTVASADRDHRPVAPVTENGWYSPTYGVREKSEQIVFRSSTGYFRTVIQADER
jgi:hypothetical protein